MDIEKIKQAIRVRKFRTSSHAETEAENDSLSFRSVTYSVMVTGEIIEDYPLDRPFPSCLIHGKGVNGEVIHSVWAYDREKEIAVIITVYTPHPDRWENDFRKRKPK